MKRLIACLLAAVLLCCSMPVYAEGAAAYSDVPSESWAAEDIVRVRDAGLMTGQGNGEFGYGRAVTRAEFAKMLCNLLEWELISPEQPSYGDVPKTAWYYSCVETALAHGAMDPSAAFGPDTPITRRQMAVMFVRALGLKGAADLATNLDIPFQDVSDDRGYITVAYDIGMINGISSTKFAPESTALREQTAAMLVRVYEKYTAKTDFIHGFYAISSYSQRALAAKMDAVTYVWSSVALDESGVRLETDSGTYQIPDGFESITGYLDPSGVKQHLGVYMDAADGVQELLLNEQDRSAAVDAIMDELTKTYEKIGKNPYSGVTIDFEGLTGAPVKAAFNSFLEELSARVKTAGETLYVTVQPALPDGTYYDGFDYRTIGSLADKVILMAHDYNPTSLSGYEGTTWYWNAAPTPISQVYYALRAATDQNSGVQDSSKLVLAISFANQGWQIDADGKLTSAVPVTLSASALAQRVAESGLTSGFSETYRDPYLTYQSDSGDRYFVWYENQQSVLEKMRLARFFDVTGVSFWRLGLIPDSDAYSVSACLN